MTKTMGAIVFCSQRNIALYTLALLDPEDSAKKHSFRAFYRISDSLKSCS
jgi:hypothetical protein